MNVCYIIFVTVIDTAARLCYCSNTIIQSYQRGDEVDWWLDKKRPICPQICEKLCVQIASGELNSGDRLMSVRDVALKAGVTPNTVQKSFEQLEQQGVISSIRGSGWYVSHQVSIAKDLLNGLIRSKTVSYLNDMQSLGLDKKEIIEIIKEFRYG